MIVVVFMVMIMIMYVLYCKLFSCTDIEVMSKKPWQCPCKLRGSTGWQLAVAAKGPATKKETAQV